MRNRQFYDRYHPNKITALMARYDCANYLGLRKAMSAALAAVSEQRGTAQLPRRRTTQSVRDGSFDDLVGVGEDRWRDRQPERLGGLEIDHQFECGRLLDRQIGGLGAIENLPGVNAQWRHMPVRLGP